MPKADGPFRPHARLALWPEGSVLRVHAEGPFNRKAVHALGLAIKQFYLALPPEQGFVYPLEFHGSLMASPDALAAVENMAAAEDWWRGRLRTGAH